jgi:hypothetical protein
VTATLSLRELGEKISAKRKQVGEIFDNNKVDGEYKLADEHVSEVRQLNAELKDLGAQYDELKEIEDIRRGTAEAEERDERDERTGRKSDEGRRDLVPNGDGRERPTKVRTSITRRPPSPTPRPRPPRAGRSRRARWTGRSAPTRCGRSRPGCRRPRKRSKTIRTS